MKITKKCHVCGKGNYISKTVDSFKSDKGTIFFKIPSSILECNVCGEILISHDSLEQIIENKNE